MFNLLCERADNVHGGRLPHHVRVLWDEAANTGQVPQLEKLVAVIRSREVSLVLLYQQLAQCKAIYDKNAETILGNMDSVIFLEAGRPAPSRKFPRTGWVRPPSPCRPRGRSRGQSESFSQNTQRLGRELMTPAELATMPGDRCILQLRGLPPFYSRKYDLKQHPNYKYTAEADKRNAFDLSRLISRRMDKLNPNEEYTVYEVDVPDEGTWKRTRTSSTMTISTTRTPLYNFWLKGLPQSQMTLWEEEAQRSGRTSGQNGQREPAKFVPTRPEDVTCRLSWRLFFGRENSRRNGGYMQFFSTAVTTLQTLVIALGAGLAVWGVVNLLEGYGSGQRSGQKPGH